MYPIHDLLFSIPLLRGHFYLDPGSGSFILQLLIAGLVGAGFLVKAYWAKIKAFFTRSSEPKKDDDANPQP
jgi:hypothetical protein